MIPSTLFQVFLQTGSVVAKGIYLRKHQKEGSFLLLEEFIDMIPFKYEKVQFPGGKKNWADNDKYI